MFATGTLLPMLFLLPRVTHPHIRHSQGDHPADDGGLSHRVRRTHFNNVGKNPMRPYQTHDPNLYLQR
jgi:hypothetical protein